MMWLAVDACWAGAGAHGHQSRHTAPGVLPLCASYGSMIHNDWVNCLMLCCELQLTSELQDPAHLHSHPSVSTYVSSSMTSIKILSL